MIDLGFVRANLPLVEEKLRSRGMDPAVVLGDFAAVDLERREAITQVETLKARRNKLTEEIAKTGVNADAAMGSLGRITIRPVSFTSPYSCRRFELLSGEAVAK